MWLWLGLCSTGVQYYYFSRIIVFWIVNTILLVYISNNILLRCSFSVSDVARIVKVQAVWRGYFTRKKGLLRDMTLRRYQYHFFAMNEQTAQLTAALNKVTFSSTFISQIQFRSAAHSIDIICLDSG